MVKSKTNKPKNAVSKKGGQRSVKANPSTTFTHSSGPMGGVATTVQRMTGGHLRLSNREFLTTLKGTAAWIRTNQWLVNVGRSVFPWLSQWACCFDAYRIKRLRFEYVPVCAATTAANIQFAYDFHVMDPAPLTEASFNMTWCKASGPAFVPNRLSVDCSRFNLQKYFTRPEGSAPDVTADLGYLYIAITGSTGVSLGQLFVDYDIELMEPQAIENPLDAQLGDSPHTAIASLPGPIAAPLEWPIAANGWYSLLNLRDWALPESFKRSETAPGVITIAPPIPKFMVESFLRGVSNAGVPAVNVGNLSTYLNVHCANAIAQYGHSDTALDAVAPFTAAAEGRLYRRTFFESIAGTDHIDLGIFLDPLLMAGLNLAASYILISPLSDLEYSKLTTF